MSRASQPLNILYEDNHLLVVNKPAGLPTMGVSEDRPSLISRARDYIRERYHKPGNVYLGVVSRLDAPVSGAIVIARTSKAASRLNAAFRKREVQKSYLSLVEGHLKEPAGELVNFLRKDERNRRMHTTHSSSEGAQRAVLQYRVVAEMEMASLLEVKLETGRKHQIRVQLAKLGHPIMGDSKYGSTKSFREGIALHSRVVEFEHPVRRELLRFVAPLPDAWPPEARRLAEIRPFDMEG